MESLQVFKNAIINFKGKKMATLKCSKCGKTFNKWFVRSYAEAGLTGLRCGLGFKYIIPIWLFVVKVYTKCPYCGKVTWMDVLGPFDKNEK
jgi:endogenous inhibitor of DNA gyrase (YacG/DUF329 family)